MTKAAQFWLVSSDRAASVTVPVGSDTKALSGVFGFATIATVLGSTNSKLVGAGLDEFKPMAVNRQRDKQYA
jgi:hypothetical protein